MNCGHNYEIKEAYTLSRSNRVLHMYHANKNQIRLHINR